MYIVHSFFITDSPVPHLIIVEIDNCLTALLKTISNYVFM
jgi:hypothetical protein